MHALLNEDTPTVSAESDTEKDPQQFPSLKICLLGYRSHPYSGGQGIYLKYLSAALCDMGHQVDVISGAPYPELDSRVKLIKMPSLGLFEKESKFRGIEAKDFLLVS